METVLITGGSRGIGKVIGESLEDAYFVDRPKRSDLDLSNPSRVLTYKMLGAKHLVYCAGIGYDDLITNMDFKKLSDMVNVNMMSAMVLTKLFIEQLVRSDNNHGSITYITSISSRTGFKGLSMYAATKGALESFSINLSKEWGKAGIRFNCVSPGFVSTDMTANLSPEDRERIIKRSSLKKLVDANDIASAVRLCITNKSMTGQTITVDAGTI